MPFLTRSDDLRLHYTIDDYTDPWKSAPVLILQHGNGRSGAFWYRWIPYLARFFRVIRPDLRGLGLTEGHVPESDLTLNTLLGDLDALLDEVGAKDVHFCGESMGGILGLAYAATRPERVRTLTLVATPVFIEDQMKERYSLGHGSRTDAMEKMGMRAWLEATTSGTRLPADKQPELFNWYIENFLKGDAQVQVAMARLVNSANAEAFLKHVNAPVLGLYPTAGHITSNAQETMLREGLSDFRMVHLPTFYHMIHLLYPATCAHEVLAFCAGFDGTSFKED